MKQILLFIITNYAQERIDTLYCNRSGQIAQNTFLGTIIASLFIRQIRHHKEFKDFYHSGELCKEGCFLSIDSLDDNKTILDGEIQVYFRNGNVAEKSHYVNGQLYGEYIHYNDDGRPITHTFYRAGELSETYKTLNEDGSYRIVEYDTGKPIHDYYLLSDNNGNTLRFRIADNMPVLESPAIAERFVDYRDGTPWEVYIQKRTYDRLEQLRCQRLRQMASI